MVRRERFEKLAFAKLLTECAKLLPGVSSDAVESMLMDYAQRVTHEVYNEPTRKKNPREKEDKGLLDKVDQMTVPEEELPELPSPKRRRGRR